MNAYIYIRNHASYDDACKMGKTRNVPDRDSQYATGEIKRGYFDPVFEIENMDIVERLLQAEFREFNIKYNAGTEFYHKDIIALIEPYLVTHNIKYRKLSTEEIHGLLRGNRVKATMQKINIRDFTKAIVAAAPIAAPTSLYIPRPDQEVIISKAVEHFQHANKGLLVLVCGVGKTLISLWVLQQLQSKTILIGVPNILLVKQWKSVIRELFPGTPSLIVSGGIYIEQITAFLETNHTSNIVITTYASAHKVYAATQSAAFTFDMKIMDEVHHITSTNITPSTKSYIQMLYIPAAKQLSLTATLKQLDGGVTNDTNETVISNDNVAHFGEIIDRKCLYWAIDTGIICDYAIQTLITDNDNIGEGLDDNDKRLYLSAFAALKSIFDGHSHHLLIYANSKENSAKIVQFINSLISNGYFTFDCNTLYYSNYHSEMRPAEQRNIIRDFETSKIAIISCVYCLGEGWDFPLLDAVVFAENMTSNIRIVQSALRASRKYAPDPAKLTKIILPILNTENWRVDVANPDMKKVREIIYQMGLEDHSVIQKIKAFTITIEKQTTPLASNNTDPTPTIGEYDIELTQYLRLHTVRRAITYERAKTILADKGIKSKTEYYALCERDNRLPIEPEIAFQGRFTNWIEYLNIQRVYYDLLICKQKVCEYLIRYPEIRNNMLHLSNTVTALCNIDTLFPPDGLWVEYYDVKNLRDIIIIPKKSRRIM